MINDGADTSLHPREKQKVGERLARWALAHDDDRSSVEFSGPIYRDYRIDGDSIRVSFEHAEGLRSRDEQPLRTFQITGADNKWVWAEAAIEGKEVRVKSPQVKQLKAVRYAWSDNPTGANLTNRSGLPASLFTTED
ncbi:hypothetical protein [Lignipirellula cremea]|uniref:Sialate O-acetylesterase domain-containing protein n=1 Tax=Lignipirellula cremea TaxID=2528010 RepID=A0A518DPR9_9BACT|nr:hypothetical protein [Lignipirellula cremea]QDU93828.1 hypothetical protein Pla8534_16110 [Lignipirellula cremea]